MHIVDGPPDQFTIADIPIEAGSLLPEAKACFAGAFANRQYIKHWIGLGDHRLLHTIRERFLDCVQQLGNFRRTGTRPHEQMDMLRHEHIGDQIVAMTRRRAIDCFRQQAASRIEPKQLTTTEAGECQRMGVARRVVVLDEFAMAHGCLHRKSIVNVDHGIAVRPPGRQCQPGVT